MSTQDRAIREGGEGEHASEHEGGDAAVGADVAGSQTLRMRAMQRRWIQRKASRGGAGGGAGGAAAIPDGAGAQLSGDVQKRMERTIGTDLSGVRVHTGGDSAEAADAMGARAFTVGSDVHFNRGEFAPGSKEGDRLLAHELTHVAQGQKSGVQRKADAAHGDAEGGDHEAGGHEVSEPGDPAEHEADAMGDHAAEKLHGGGAKGEVKEGGGDKHGGAEPKPAGKQAAPVSRKASPNALLSSRKIHLAPKPGAKTATPDPKAADKGGGKGEKPKSAEELGKEKMIDQLISEMSKLDVADPKLAVQVSLGLQSVEKDLVKFPSNDIVKGFKAYLATKKQSIIEKCGEEIGTLVKKLEEIKAENPAEAEKLHALQGSPLIDKWNRNSICGGAVALKDRHPKIVDFQQGLAAKLKTNDDAIKKDKEAKKADEAKAHAPGGVQGGTPPGPPDKKATAAPTAVAPPATAAVASPQAPAKLDAKATGAPDAKAGGGPQKPADAKATDAKPLDAKAGGGKPGGAGGEHSPPPPTVAATPKTPEAKTEKPAPTPAATPVEHKADGGEHKVDGGEHKPVGGPVPEAKAADGKAPAPDGKGAHHAGEGEHAGGDPAKAGNPAEELKKEELEKKKEVAKARIDLLLASTSRSWKGLGAVLDVVGAALSWEPVKAIFAAHGIEIPEGLGGMLKDGAAGYAKAKDKINELMAAVAKVSIDSIETLEEMDALFAEAHLDQQIDRMHFHIKHLTQEEALQKEAIKAFEAKFGKAPLPGAVKKGDEGGEEAHEEKKEEKKEKHNAAGAGEHGKKDGEEEAKKADGDDKAKKPGVLKRVGKAGMKAADTAVGAKEGEESFEDANPAAKQALEHFDEAIEPIKVAVSLWEAGKAQFVELHEAKEKLKEAEAELAAVLKESGGKALPEPVKK